jgi:hypothetical protein
MSYTIRLLDDPSVFAFQQIHQELFRAIKDDGRFSVGSKTICVEAGYQTIKLNRIRLITKKSYCGNHPGPCDAINRGRKMNATYLEWDDWVAFHSIVNGALDSLQVEADVWTLPLDVSGKFFIRRGMKARVKFDYDTEYNTVGRSVRVWNTGTPDQFEVL